MAAASNDKKRVMDVSKPGKTAPSATTRPLIVSHSGTIIDPTAGNDIQSAPVPSAETMNGKADLTAAKPRGAKVLQPLSAQNADVPESEVAAKMEAEGTSTIKVLPIEDASSESAKLLDSGVGVAASGDSQEGDAEASASSGDADKETTTEPPKDEPASESADDTESDSSSESQNDENSNTSSSDNESAAIVDAVVDQANVGKRQKEEDKELMARKELVDKLVEEKKYFIPIRQKNTTRSGRMTTVLSILGILMLLGGYAAVDAGVVDPGFDVPFHVLGKKEAATSVVSPDATATANTPTPTQPAPQPTAPVTLSYDNKELGVSFSYPSSWGDVGTKKQPGSVSGNAVTFTFSKQPLLIAGMVSRDYKEQGRDGVCYVTLGILPPTTLAAISGLMTESDAQASQTSATRVLKKTADTFIYERFETGESTGTETCLGLSTIGYVAFKSTASYTGVQFYWGGDAGSRKPVPLAELSVYRATPSKYLDDATRQSFVSMVESAKSQ